MIGGRRPASDSVFEGALGPNCTDWQSHLQSVQRGFSTQTSLRPLLHSPYRRNQMATTRTSTLSKGRLAQLTRAYPVLQGYATLPWLLVFLIPLLVDTGVVRGGW